MLQECREVKIDNFIIILASLSDSESLEISHIISPAAFKLPKHNIFFFISRINVLLPYQRNNKNNKNNNSSNIYYWRAKFSRKSLSLEKRAGRKKNRKSFWPRIKSEFLSRSSSSRKIKSRFNHREILKNYFSISKLSSIFFRKEWRKYRMSNIQIDDKKKSWKTHTTF